MLNQLIVKTLPLVPKSIVKSIANRYIAGADLNDAISTVKSLHERGATSTVDVLGEFVTSKDRAEREYAASMSVIDAISQHRLPAYLSVKLTSLGLDIDPEYCYKNLRTMVKKAADSGTFVRMDMENSPYTTKTLDFYRRIRDEGFDNIGVVIQAYMKRSEADIKSLLSYKPDIRLCKGIYIESPDIAFKEFERIRQNYSHLLRVAIDGGATLRIATHDDALIDDAIGYVKAIGLAGERYEFQMLLGVREERRDQIIRSGHRMRIYVPFGHDWYGYSVRRLKENPKVAGYVFKAMFFKG